MPPVKKNAPKDKDKTVPVIPDDHAALDPNTGELRPYYCPGCGRGYLVPVECNGTAAAPHAPIQTVDSAELDGDPADHTPAPNTGE